MEKVYIDYFKENPCKDCNAIENCKSLGIECALREHYINDAISKQKAIKVMAKALCHRHCPEKVCTSCDEWEKYGTKEDAEAALNALLKGGKL